VSSRVALRLDLAPEAASVREARAFLRDALRAWQREDLVDTATLLISELATNVVLHARTPFAVVAVPLAQGMRCDVLDNAAAVPAVREHDLSAATGRGLALLDGLSDEWGATPSSALDGFRKGVRFELR